ncbi:MAG TPA: 3-phosphoshikimate 1-carboxyvinyltransferase [Dissulfurispiraceae bacterium]|nr:3-phosphoshikimate 1-carboxyvinyltransferase [Dissulfurispiraceae bacterium]
MEIKKARRLRGEITPPPDKSISHRAAMFASVAEGRSVIRNYLRAGDPLSTLGALRMLGVAVREERNGDVIIEGNGLRGLTEPSNVIDCGNSGTTMRLLSGIVAANEFFTVLTGDDSLRNRPMKRIIAPLTEMGARISARDGDRYPPIAIRGGRLKPVTYALPVASAQVKSCLILAGLLTEGETVVTEPLQSRDHTERMLASMGAAIAVDGLSVSVTGNRELHPLEMTVPADFSSAAFLLAAALIVPGSDIILKDVGMNPTRTGLIPVLRSMGAIVEVENLREISGEPVADIRCRTAGGLRGVTVGAETIPSIIDEFPILCVVATQAGGVTEIRGAGELRIKESDRIRAMVTELKKLGADIEELHDGVLIRGGKALRGSPVSSHHDHRIAMSLAVAALVADGSTVIGDTSCVDISFPGFFDHLSQLRA